MLFASRRIACQVGARRQSRAGKANRLRLRESDEPVVKILIAEDDPVSRRLLEARLLKDGHQVILAEDGEQAWLALQKDATIPLAILDWNMPGLTGAEICQQARQIKTDQPLYLILLTSRDTREDIVSGLQAGANDYVTKPFDFDELRARVQVGERVVHHRAAEVGKVRIPCATGIHGRGDAAVQAQQRVHAVQVPFVPVAMQVDEPRTDVLAANVEGLGVR